MKKYKPFTKRGAFAGNNYKVHYFPDDPAMERSMAVELSFLERRPFRLDIFASDVKHTRKFIKALKKGLRRLEK